VAVSYDREAVPRCEVASLGSVLASQRSSCRGFAAGLMAARSANLTENGQPLSAARGHRSQALWGENVTATLDTHPVSISMATAPS
jgi:hypothetical protein